MHKGPRIYTLPAVFCVITEDFIFPSDIVVQRIQVLGKLDNI